MEVNAVPRKFLEHACNSTKQKFSRSSQSAVEAGHFFVRKMQLDSLQLLHLPLHH